MVPDADRPRCAGLAAQSSRARRAGVWHRACVQAVRRLLHSPARAAGLPALALAALVTRAFAVDACPVCAPRRAVDRPVLPLEPGRLLGGHRGLRDRDRRSPLSDPGSWPIADAAAA